MGKQRPRLKIDPGHGGDDPGAIGIYQTKEKKLTLGWAKYLFEQIRDTNVKPILSRRVDRAVSLEKRIKGNYHYFISLHFNAYRDQSAQGFEIYHQQNARSIAWARKIKNDCLPFEKQIPMRGIKNGSHLYVLRNCPKPAILVEFGFITSPDDMHHLLNVDFRENMLDQIASSTLKYINNH